MCPKQSIIHKLALEKASSCVTEKKRLRGQIFQPEIGLTLFIKRATSTVDTL